jgi:monovalent cation:H+ antiporter-2, CPA2 family
MHDISLITTIALGLGAAFIFGLLARRVGLSPIVGYLLAGVAIGPHTPGFAGDIKLASQLAEIGVILLMFGVGLHFSLKDLAAVKSIAIPGALGQSAVATTACMLVALSVGWGWKAGMILGIAASVASTVVLLRALMDRGAVESPEGRAAVGWLVVEDIITVLVLVLLPPLAVGGGKSGLLETVALALGKLVLLTAIVLFAGARFVPWLLLRVARLRSGELFTLAVLVIAMCVATVSYIAFGASMALGAFLGGMVVGQSKVSDQAEADILPMRNMFAVLFFVAVGMLFDYRALLDQPLLTLGVVAVILVVKPLIALVIVILGGHSLRTGLTVAGGLAQIGEFSFIVGDMARSLGLMPASGSNALVAGAIISISLNPFLFRRILALEPRMEKWRWLAPFLDRAKAKRASEAATNAAEIPTDPGAIVVGYGPVGQTFTRVLGEFGIQPTIIETNVDAVLQLQKSGMHAIYGDATRPEILQAAGITSAAYLVVTLPKSEACLRVIHAAREEAPLIRVFSRASYINQHEAFVQAGAAIIRYDEAETAVALAKALLQDIDAPQDRVSEVIRSIRKKLTPRPKPSLTD